VAVEVLAEVVADQDVVESRADDRLDVVVHVVPLAGAAVPGLLVERDVDRGRVVVVAEPVHAVAAAEVVCARADAGRRAGRAELELVVAGAAVDGVVAGSPAQHAALRVVRASVRIARVPRISALRKPY
jgi:hypothetical protein